ncbi:Uncharacterised protein [Mycobacteroides abscessus subsp. abscessus]|nr:Uncharacterised protein [Mycobacteroides abscessus subsp. abscessus]
MSSEVLRHCLPRTFAPLPAAPCRRTPVTHSRRSDHPYRRPASCTTRPPVRNPRCGMRSQPPRVRLRSVARDPYWRAPRRPVRRPLPDHPRGPEIRPGAPVSGPARHPRSVLPGRDQRRSRGRIRLLPNSIAAAQPPGRAVRAPPVPGPGRQKPNPSRAGFAAANVPDRDAAPHRAAGRRNRAPWPQRRRGPARRSNHSPVPRRPGRPHRGEPVPQRHRKLRCTGSTTSTTLRPGPWAATGVAVHLCANRSRAVPIEADRGRPGALPRLPSMPRRRRSLRRSARRTALRAATFDRYRWR